MSGDGRAFFDTNVLLYMYGGDASKRIRARNLFQQCVRDGRLILSTQVLQEFYAAGSRKLKIAPAILKEMVLALMDLPTVTVTSAEIRAALANEEQFGISFWDALILAAAQAGNASTVYSEDLNDGQRYGSVTVRNPFQLEVAQ